MGLAPQDADRLFELLSRGWDEGFTPAAVAEIESFVEQHGREACELLVKLTELHVELGTIVASSRAFERALAGISAELAQGPEVAPRADEPRKRRSVRLWPLAGAAAALLAMAGGMLWYSANPDPASQAARQSTFTLMRPPQPVACVTSLSEAAWGGDEKLEVGQTLKQHQRLQLLSGTAQVSMACGADIVLQAPCAVVLDADDVVILEHGKLTAQAAKWATGFVVETRGLRVTDLGTRFAIAADASGIAEAHVLEGEVLAEPMKAHRPKLSSMLLKSGEAIRVSVPQATIDRIAAQRARFVDRLKIFRPLRPIEIWNSGVGSALGEGDSHWQVVAGEERHGPYPRAATITPGDPAYLDNSPEASQWISVHDEVYPGVKPTSVHTFETRFNLSGYDLKTVHIVGLFLVDDAINELRINGRPVPFERWETTWNVYDFKSFHPIEIIEGFVPGENVISIDVFNSPSRPENPTQPNPMSLRVEWQAFGCWAE